jgi:mRNA interferase MazF
MVVPAYVPARGDLVWLDFSPQRGHEQSGRRPALVLSPIDYNRKTGLALFCPITSKKKGYTFECALPDGLGVSGVVLADQVKNLAWHERNVELAGVMPPEATNEVLKHARVLLA